MSRTNEICSCGCNVLRHASSTKGNKARVLRAINVSTRLCIATFLYFAYFAHSLQLPEREGGRTVCGGTASLHTLRADIVALTCMQNLRTVPEGHKHRVTTPENPRNITRTPQNPAETPQNPRRDPAEPSERPPQSPLRGKFPRRASRRVVPPEW